MKTKKPGNRIKKGIGKCPEHFIALVSTENFYWMFEY